MESTLIPKRPTGREVVASYLRPLILRGDLEPGARLSVPELSERLGVSQTPVREALQLLEGEGLVRIDPYKGGRVADLDAGECEEIYLMRAALERLASRLGTEKIDAAGIKGMRIRLDQMERAAKKGDIDAFIEADWEFHRVHFGATGRQSLLDRIMGLRRESERYTRATYTHSPGRLMENVEIHRELVRLIEARDIEGAEAWVTDVLTDVNEVLQLLIGEQEHDLTTP